ncbi:MAG: GNAT family N-acetyltransferase [Alistipes sp.]|nr:GNAT family N-acetyltransferase [Alistipes sp.]
MIRKTVSTDIEPIMAIVHDAQQALRELGIDQWQNGYPTRDIILGDIADGVGFVCVDGEGTVLGYVAIVLTGEVVYKQLDDSAWHTGEDYVVVHRLCVKSGSYRKGVATALMRYAADCARKHAFTGFRIDTHRGNTRMLNMLATLGFEPTGVIDYDGSERVAYDLNLGLSKIL